MTSETNKIEMLKSIAKFLQKSIMAKVVIISLIIFALNIPQYLILDLVKEREKRSHEVIGEISKKWGQEQSVIGPILYLPSTKTSYFPQSLKVEGELNPSKRYKSLFSTIVYSAKLSFSSHFDLEVDQDLSGAQLVFLVSDLQGLSQKITLTYADQEIDAQAGTPDLMQGMNGFHFPLKIQNQKQIDIACQFSLNGSKKIQIYPSGRQSQVKLKSTWPHPGFNGTYLPYNYHIDQEGFNASWEIHDLQRNFVQTWQTNRSRVSDMIELDLVEVNGHYFQVNRIVKYSLLFLCFTFGAVFVCERMGQRVIHPLQYLLFGISGLVFYLLLLSLSEHISFAISYFIAAFLCSSMIGFYSRGVLQNKKQATGIFAVVSLLYSYLYGTIQLEDYALLMGSVGLFVILGLLMYFTRDLSSKGEANYEQF